MTIKIFDLDVAKVIDAQAVKGATGWNPNFYVDFFKQPLSNSASATATSTAVSHPHWPTLALTQTLAITRTSAAGSYSRSSSTAAILPQA